MEYNPCTFYAWMLFFSGWVIVGCSIFEWYNGYPFYFASLVGSLVLWSLSTCFSLVPDPDLDVLYGRISPLTFITKTTLISALCSLSWVCNSLFFLYVLSR